MRGTDVEEPNRCVKADRRCLNSTMESSVKMFNYRFKVG